MITQCPSCHTHFRVHAEQLAARAGQVRCGRCSRVFDALEHLIEETVPPHTSGPNFRPDTSGLDVPGVKPAPAPDDVISEETAVASLEPAAVDPEEVRTPMEQPARAEIAEAQTEVPDPYPGEITAGPPVPPEPEADAPERYAAEPTLPASMHFEPEAMSAAGPFDFGPTAAARPARRWPWLLGALLLLCVLLVQVAYQYRSAVLLLLPELKPYAVELCASLGCDLPLPRRIELLSIEASDLQADTTNPSVMVLAATLKNRAIFMQQHPSLELTLTDAQDQPVVRRVLAPQDYLGKAVSPQTGFGANTEIAVKVFIEGSQVKATGYRLYLFFP